MEILYSIETITSNAVRGWRHQLGPGRHVLGRASDCELPLDAEGVSRRHAELEVLADGGVLVSDLGSTNGTRVDGRPIKRCAMSGDFVLQVGTARLRMRAHVPEWSALAYVTGDCVPMEAETGPVADEQTRQIMLVQQLRRALRDSVPLSAALMDTLSLALQRMLEPLQAGSLCVVDEQGRVLAAAGSLQLERVRVAGGECWHLEMDSASPLAEAAGRILGPFLDWLPTEISAPEARHASCAPEPFPGVPSTVASMRRNLAALERVAQSRLGILLLGETGVGKDLVARWIHRCSPRARGPYVAINCAALPEDLLEAELFGVAEGAATGVRARAGVFEQADGGTLFLDELGDMSPRTQVRLLRVLEDGRVHRVGGTSLVQVDVRLIAATHRDLNRAIEIGAFRSDLYHRLAGFETTIPPLRERAVDIASLAIHFYREALEESGLSSRGITVGAMRALQGWHWPGNVRELRQVIAAAVAGLLPGEALDLQHLPERIRAAAGAPGADEIGPGTSLAEILADAERRALTEALHASGGDPEAAWTRLGISKSGFYEKIKRHGLARPEKNTADG
ncbi:MAG: hypothetical protein Kow0020_14320 [Wenzhouxiangellaceae bacterium]